MGKRTGAEVGVAAVIRSDDIHPQLQGFRHAPTEAFRSVQGDLSRGPKDLAPGEVTWATEATNTDDLQSPHDLQP